MFMTRGQKLIAIILIVTAVLTVLAILLLLKPEVGTTALAQGGGESGKDEEITNYQEAIKKHDLSDMIITPLVASSQESTIDPQSDGSGVEVVPIGAFRNIGNNADSWRHFFPGGYIRNNSSSQVCFMAPTYPPDGATLTAFRASLLDDHSTKNLLVELYRVGHTVKAFDGAEPLAAVTSSGKSSTGVEITDPSIATGKETVSNAYSYYVYLCFDPDTTDFPSDEIIFFYGARLAYTP